MLVLPVAQSEDRVSFTVQKPRILRRLQPINKLVRVVRRLALAVRRELRRRRSIAIALAIHRWSMRAATQGAAVSAGGRAIRRWRHSHLTRAFSSLVAHYEVHRLIGPALRNVLYRHVARALRTWREAAATRMAKRQDAYRVLATMAMQQQARAFRTLLHVAQARRRLSPRA